MVKGDFVFNVIVYTLVIGYILFINFSAYYNNNNEFLGKVTRLFQNGIFRTIFLLVIGVFALDLFPYGGFILAVLLTIAFLNTTMLIYKNNITEKFTEYSLQGGSEYESYESHEDFANEDDDEQENFANEDESHEDFANEDEDESHEDFANEDDDEENQENFANEDDDESHEDFANEDDEDENQENFANEDDDNQENFANEDDDESQEDFGSCKRESFEGSYVEQFSNCQKKESFSNVDGLQSPKNCGPYAPLQRLPFNPQGYDSRGPMSGWNSD